MRSVSLGPRARSLPCDVSTKSLHTHAEDDHDGAAAARECGGDQCYRRRPLRLLLKSQFCCLLGGAVMAAAATARADALIVSLLVLPTHTVAEMSSQTSKSSIAATPRTE